MMPQEAELEQVIARKRQGRLAALSGEGWSLTLSLLFCGLLLAFSFPAVPVVGFWLVFLLFLWWGPPLPRTAEDSPQAQDRDEADGEPAVAFDPLAAAFDALDMPVLVISRSQQVVFQNQAAETIFGVIPPMTDLAARLRSPAILDLMRETIATGRPNQIEHSQHLPAEAVYILRAAPVMAAEAAAPPLFVLSFRDISQTRRIERMRSDFVANASHELRTPLASLRGFIETLLGPARNDPQAHARFLGIMLEQTNRMSRLIDDLLSLSRLELKAHIAPDQAVDLAPLLGHVRDALLPLAGELDVEVDLILPPTPVIVRGDGDELIQVFQNLVENACKYGQEGKRVEVRLTGGDGRPVEVAVEDWGPGMAAEHVPRVTERFYRVNVEASRSKKGTGLGLAIVKHILTRHRARLIIQSELGQGTIFTVRF
ncbi:phosphate regulon sensor histidine kinase PhoR [Xaviernesmea oryzae]|uniref:histidine kinase n=2 Tax=Xaviernesmea oryzae TaxID=464029 RepID=A0A1Q9ASJ7_9HYPH|nr:phosphate regulon sensor histidine kinase PhoR [Xaviernesmea oryzae]SEL42303.1 two-component system, OmpR family, phosphate regulon sensor histidine kinase PhoR [Xaviernesmea oryzae]